MLKKLFSWKVILGLVILPLGLKIWNTAYENYRYKKYLAGLKDTASDQVVVFPDTLMVDYLEQPRMIRIYLPKDYEVDSIAYPVIYFMDGQALFN